MVRRVFFSFEYGLDVSRAMVVRNSWVTQEKTTQEGSAQKRGEAAGFVDAADFEKVKQKGDKAVRDWIDKQLKGTSVTVVLVGKNTCDSKWVKYEIEKSREVGNGLLGIDVSKIEDLKGNTTNRCGRIPAGYSFYCWDKDKGYENMGDWIEKAAQEAYWSRIVGME
ncbi:MAG: TIR domain-containing protein [Rhodospirillales bacterium]|nr:TIR domain-containing protein [Rhodospirillales bacterium]